jgi:hypothetical protein
MSGIEETLEKLVGRVRTVRGWLVALAVLRVTALSLGFLSFFVLIYALLDDRFHLGIAGRFASFSLLLGCLFALIYFLVRFLLGHVSCSQAANYIERRFNFEQQLVTAIEYHEKRENYPYSKVLAEHLVREMDRRAESVPFDKAIPKWQAGVLGIIIFAGLIVGGSYMHTNYVFFSRYLARLVHPLAKVEPLPATVLTSRTKDLTGEPGQIFNPLAQAEGRLPQEASLVIEPRAGKDRRIIPIEPVYKENHTADLTADVVLPEGEYTYRFQIPGAASAWHKITVTRLPKVEKMTARISVSPDGFIQPYTQEVKDNVLEIPKGSHVKLSVKATEMLRSASVTNLEKKDMLVDTGNHDTFDAEFDASKEGYVNIKLTNHKGVVNEQIPPLQVVIKENQPATFKLISPPGDYTATTVGSVPITFEVTDDFGLDSGAILLEIPGKDLLTIDQPIQKGTRKATITYTLELENYDLALGDSVLFYARAADLDVRTGKTSATPATSEVNFIEIGPYRRIWFQGTAPLPNQEKQGLKGAAHDALMAVLEYTRAIVKKTWVIAQKSQPDESDPSRLNSINKDVDYAAGQLGMIRDDPRYGFDALDKAKLNEIIGYYNQAGNKLAAAHALGALAEEKLAYRELRKFIMDLARVLMPGSGDGPVTAEGPDQPDPKDAKPKDQSKKDKPDQTKLEDPVHLTRYEKERIEWELKTLADKLEALKREEEELKKTFDHFLARLEERNNPQSAVNDERTTASKEKQPPAPEHAEGAEKTNTNKANQKQNGKLGLEGAMAQTPKDSGKPSKTNKGKVKGKEKANGQEDGKEEGQSGAEGKGQKVQSGGGSPGGGNQNTPASSQEQLDLLMSKQKALQEETKGIQNALEQLPAVEGESPAETLKSKMTRTLARQALHEAQGLMEEFQKNLGQAYYQNEPARSKTMTQASNNLAGAAEKLTEAAEALEQQYTRSKLDQVAKSAQQAAGDMEKIANAIDESVSKDEREKMMADLEEAKRLLETITDSRIVKVEDSMAQPNQVGGKGGFAKTNTHLTGNLPPRVQARLLALKFWSISIQARNRKTQIMEEEPSDSEYREMEKSFFERAAQYNKKGNE